MFTWKILEIFVDAKGVKYLASMTDGENTVESEGNHWFTDGLIKKDFKDIKESDLIGWLNSDTTKNDVNAIKLNLEIQLESLKNSEKTEFPWLTDTFTME